MIRQDYWFLNLKREKCGVMRHATDHHHGEQSTSIQSTRLNKLAEKGRNRITDGCCLLTFPKRSCRAHESHSSGTGVRDDQCTRSAQISLGASDQARRISPKSCIHTCLHKNALSGMDWRETRRFPFKGVRCPNMDPPARCP
jgi:hypothetical protein